MAENYSLMRKGFRILNRFFMVPAFRLGFGAFLGSPFGGYFMVIKHRGHLTGKQHYTPVNYAIANGNVYCTAGFGEVSHWLKNIRKYPQVELILPGGTIAATAEIVEPSEEKKTALRQAMINSGFAAYVFGGINVAKVTDEKLMELASDYVVLRFKPAGLGAGPFDPAGWFWIWPITAILMIIWLILK